MRLSERTPAQRAAGARRGRRLLAAGVSAATAGLVLGVVPAGASHRTSVHRVDTTADTADVAPGDGWCADADGNCSLRAAVQEANAGGGASRIQLAADTTYALDLTGSGTDDAATGDLDVVGTLTISGAGAVIDLESLGDRAFDVHAGASLQVSRLGIMNGAPPVGESGGAIANAGMLTTDRLIAHDNVAEGEGASGGAIFNEGTARIIRSELFANSATRAGGAVEANGGITKIVQSTLSGNTTGPMPGNGGALHLTGDGYVAVTDSSVTDNVAASEGGGLWNSAVGTMDVVRSTITGNVANGTDADTGGGGLFNDGGVLTVDHSTVSDNEAVMGSASGGGVLNLGLFRATHTDIDRNVSARAGGGVEANDVNGGGDSILRYVSLVGNATGAAPGNGGAVHVTGSSVETIIKFAEITGNTAANEGGGLWNFEDATMTVTNSTIEGNVAPIGPDVFQNGAGGQFTIDGSSVN